MYVCAVESKAGPRFGGLCVKNWSKSCVKNWSKFCVHCFPHFLSILGHVEKHKKCQFVPNSAFAILSGYQ